MLLVIKAIWPQKICWRSKKGTYFENKRNSPYPKKRLGYAHRRRQVGYFPEISCVSCLFVVWEAVSKANTVALKMLKSKDFPAHFCGIATPQSIRRDKHPKKLEAINGTFPWKVFIAPQGHRKWSGNVFPRHSGNGEVYSLHRVNDRFLLILSFFFVQNTTISR